MGRINGLSTPYGMGGQKMDCKQYRRRGGGRGGGVEEGSKESLLDYVGSPYQQERGGVEDNLVIHLVLNGERTKYFKFVSMPLPLALPTCL